MSVVRQKLPKQWKHWCKDSGLTVHARRTTGQFARGRWAWFCLQGRGHYWRVNCFGDFERGDTYEEFDRWALCEVREVPMPKTLSEFRAAVKSLLAPLPEKMGKEVVA